MPSMTSLFKRLERDHPAFTFRRADGFWWSAADETIYVDTTAAHSDHFSLHELSHALLGHSGYHYDIDLVKLERDAWEYAKTVLAPRYNIEINKDIVEDNLDTYREWLHARSTCPACSATGIQSKQHDYRCLDCGQPWRANEARSWALRRASLQTK